MDTVEFHTFKPHIEDSPGHIPESSSFIPPWIFKHRDLTEKLEKANKIDHKRLVNIINYIHFKEGHLFILFNHPKLEDGILIKAYPEPCTGCGELICHWEDQTASRLLQNTYSFQQLIISDGESFVLVPGRLKDLNDHSITIQLPDKSYDISQRRIKRYQCEGIQAEIIQNGVLFEGTVLDFSPVAFCIQVQADTMSSFTWFNPEASTIVYLRKAEQIIFSGTCRFIRQTSEITGRKIVLAPLEKEIARFRKVIIRSPRHTLIPPPTINFRHPLFKREIKREIFDISNTGFSINEKVYEGVLMPGMILNDLTIQYAGALDIKCTAQVVYRHETDDTARCGLAILDMSVKEFGVLTQLLSQVSDHYNFISNTVDMESLWEFFFDTNFIYPEKYSHIQSYRDDFKDTYRKLYHGNPEIAQHFTYEKDGKVYGHIAMIRAYERAWMIHHFAARQMESKLTGFLVLKQIMHYLNGLYRLRSANMDYIMTYYREGNKIIDRVFGGFEQYLENPQGCSLDIFSYLMMPRGSSEYNIPENWSIRECTDFDMWNLGIFYDYNSGGLLMNALGLGTRNSPENTIENSYKRLGFKRKMKAYSLVHENHPAAFFIINHSNLGLNLSELINGIKVFVTGHKSVPWHILSIALAHLSVDYTVDKVPVMIYPANYAEEQEIPVEKHYKLWILNIAQYADQYLQYMGKKFRLRLR